MIDFALDDNGDLPAVSRLITGDELIMQRIRLRLGIFRGEWVQDAEVGLPYIEWTAKPTPISGLLLSIETAIKAIPGVLRIDNLAAVKDINTRKINITGRVVLESLTETPLTFQLGG